jgi:hypothetical protein
MINRKTLMNLKSSEQGYVLYFALILLFVLASFVATILTSQRMNNTQSQRELNKLQATVLSYSGLELAKAYVSGYDGRDFLWETQDLKHDFLQGGSVTLSASHSAGWLSVHSIGSFIKDTSECEGVLGQVPPSFSSNAINIVHSDNDVVVNDRATLNGDIATSGGKVITRNNGTFSGKIKRIFPVVYNSDIAEQEFNVFDKQFGALSKDSTIQHVKPEEIGQMFRPTENKQVKSLFVEGDVSLKSVDLDFKDAVLYVKGDVTVSGASNIKSASVYVLGKTEIKDRACVQFCNIVSLGNLFITDSSIYRGNALCAESLVVRGGANVYYPSFLYLSSGQKGSMGDRVVLIQDNACVKGIITTGNFNDNAMIPRIQILDRSNVSGLLFCMGGVTPFGRINGSIYLEKIIYRQERTVYENWLRQVTVSYLDISQMTTPMLFPKEYGYRFMQIKQVRGGVL